MDDFVIKKQLARGGSALISSAEITNESIIQRAGANTCVIKRILNGEDCQNEEQKSSFCQEVSLMWFYRSHPNFVKIYGFCMNPMFIAMKHYELGSLGQFMTRRRDESGQVTSEVILHFAFDIANGLTALHNSGIVHYDMKPENLLVDIDKVGKLIVVIADMGISAIVNSDLINVVRHLRTVQILGASAAFAAPEVFKRLRPGGPTSILDLQIEPDIAKAADIYAYSITLWEMVTKKKAWKQIRSWEGIETRVCSGERPEFPEETEKLCKTDSIVLGLVKIIAVTWCQDPAMRMPMEKVLVELQKLYDPKSLWPLNNVTSDSNANTAFVSNQVITNGNTSGEVV